MKKRGQVTLFIIIGIVILAALLGFAFREQISRVISRIFQPEAEPLRVFIERCADISGEQAVQIAASQGGYINIPDRLALSFDGYLPPQPAPVQVPMWWYQGNDYIPTVDEMEQQLSDYVKDSMDDCLNDFNAFAQFDVIEKGNLTVETEIHEEDVRFVINYPLLVKPKAANETIQLDRFLRIIDRPLGKLYELGTAIMALENDIGFIENVTMDIIAVADGAGDSPYFPYEGFDIRCGTGKIWSEQFQLIPDLQDMLHYNLNYVIFQGTSYADPGYEYFRDQYSFRASEKNYPEVQAKILYNRNWGMELDVEPSDGDIVRGIPMKIPILGSCIQIYHHRYDIEYPIMLRLEDLENGLVFNFATPIIIEKNLPHRYVSDFTRRFEYSISNADYCTNRAEDRTVVVRDEVTGEAIEDADLSYECVRFTCSLGKTEVPRIDRVPIYGSTPSLTTRFPQCVNGFLVANKEGYLEKVVQYTSGPGAGTPPAIVMTPLIKLNMSARVLELQDGQLNIRALDEGESVAIFVRNEESNYDETFFYPPKQFYKKDFELIYEDIVYEFDAKLIKNDMVTGGLFLENWTVRRDVLSSADEIVINLITGPEPPETFDEFAVYFRDVIVPESKKYEPVIR